MGSSRDSKIDVDNVHRSNGPLLSTTVLLRNSQSRNVAKSSQIEDVPTIGRYPFSCLQNRLDPLLRSLLVNLERRLLKNTTDVDQNLNKQLSDSSNAGEEIEYSRLPDGCDCCY